MLLETLILARISCYVATGNPMANGNTNCMSHKEMFNNMPIEQEIRYWSLVNDVNPVVAIRIANCESKMGTQLFNKTSSAKGIYQFLDKTWLNYCKGNVLNRTDNINCFSELYNKHRNWWACK